jgi:hypothetical protein
MSASPGLGCHVVGDVPGQRDRGVRVISFLGPTIAADLGHSG